MLKHGKVIGGIVFAIVLLCVLAWVSKDATLAVLDPKGTISAEQKQLLLFAVFLSVFVVIPVFALTIFISVRYREGNKKADYKPDWDHSKKLELIWWGVPIALIAILSVVTWRTSHSLDPFKPLASDKQPLVIQAVSLQWKWLFIYPEQNVAAVNFVQLPLDRPVRFEITSDAPMNSLWIPQLGSQIYAMSGMSTQLNLMATEPGDFYGMSSNLSGSGFSGMHFTARASSEADFGAWVRDTRQAHDRLSLTTYQTLTEPSQNNPVHLYSSVDEGLYDTIVMQYMGHMGAHQHTHEAMQ